MTAPAWDLVLAHVAESLSSALRDHPRIRRPGLRRWARGVARKMFEVDQLPRGGGQEIDGLVEKAITASI